MVYISEACEEMSLRVGIPGFHCWGDLRIETSFRGRQGVGALVFIHRGSPFPGSWWEEDLEPGALGLSKERSVSNKRMEPSPIRRGLCT